MALRFRVRLVPTRPTRDEALLDIALPPVKRHADDRGATPSVDTPAGLPLKFYVAFRGDWGAITVKTAATRLLRVNSAFKNTSAELRLPTDEVIEFSVYEQT